MKAETQLAATGELMARHAMACNNRLSADRTPAAHPHVMEAWAAVCNTLGAFVGALEVHGAAEGLSDALAADYLDADLQEPRP